MCIILKDLWIETVLQTIALEVRISAEERNTFLCWLACACARFVVYSTGLILCTIAHPLGCVIHFSLRSVALCLRISSTHKRLSEISLSLLRAFLWQRFTAMNRGDFAEMVFVLKEIALYRQA